MHDATPTPENPTTTRRPLLSRLPWGPILLVVAFVAVWAWLGRTAPTPPAFDTGMTLSRAVEDAGSSDRLVLAVATADWCTPCQGYKRGALVDARIEAWIEANAVPVYINIDESPDDARLLDVQSIPATFLIRDGEVIARAQGAMGAGALLEWLDRPRAQ